MKTRIKKIIIMAFALLFVSVGVSFAHDGNRRGSHKSRGPFYGHYEKQPGNHHGWHNKYYQAKHYHRDKYRHRDHHQIRRDYHNYNRHSSHKGTIIGFRVNEPDFKFAVVVKGRR